MLVLKRAVLLYEFLGYHGGHSNTTMTMPIRQTLYWVFSYRIQTQYYNAHSKYRQFCQINGTNNDILEGQLPSVSLGVEMFTNTCRLIGAHNIQLFARGGRHVTRKSILRTSSHPPLYVLPLLKHDHFYTQNNRPEKPCRQGRMRWQWNASRWGGGEARCSAEVYITRQSDGGESIVVYVQWIAARRRARIRWR